MSISLRGIKKGLSTKISKCIALLSAEFTSLNYTIYFYESREKFEKEHIEKPEMKDEQYTQILNGVIETSGVTIGEKGKIKIFLFLFDDVKKDPNEVIKLIGNIYHEIRHAWQNEKGLFKDEEELYTIDGNLEEYYSLPSEKDAYRFQEEKMQTYGNEILKIFGFNFGIHYQLKPEIKKVIDS